MGVELKGEGVWGFRGLGHCKKASGLTVSRVDSFTSLSPATLETVWTLKAPAWTLDHLMLCNRSSV